MLLLEVVSLLSVLRKIVNWLRRWNEEHTQTRTRKVHQLEEVDMLTIKIDLLMKKLENPGLDHLKMVDARITCEECGKHATWASTAQRSLRISISLVIPTMVFILFKASMLGGTNPVSYSTTANKVVWGRTSTEVNLLSRILFGVS
jgi:hypothetical protein